MENIYNGILIDSEIQNGRTSGSIKVQANQIEFISDNVHYIIPFSQLTIHLGGANNNLIFLNDKNFKDKSLYTNDKSILKNNSLLGVSNLKNDIQQLQKVRVKNYLGFVLILSIIVLFFVGLYFSKDYFVEKIADQVPITWEQSAGDHLFTSVVNKNKIVKDDSILNILNNVSEPLLKLVEVNGVDIELFIVKDPNINAFALPGGKVVIQTGLIENANSWEEVLGVLGHELAHVSRRHHVRGVINNIGLYALISATIGDISALAGTFANVGNELASLSNSRNFETEADETGWNYLVDAKINPKGLIAFFQTLEKENKSDYDFSFLSTHPNTTERIKVLQSKLTPKLEKLPLIQNNYQDFKNLVKNY